MIAYVIDIDTRIPYRTKTVSRTKKLIKKSNFENALLVVRDVESIKEQMTEEEIIDVINQINPDVQPTDSPADQLMDELKDKKRMKRWTEKLLEGE